MSKSWFSRTINRLIKEKLVILSTKIEREYSLSQRGKSVIEWANQFNSVIFKRSSDSNHLSIVVSMDEIHWLLSSLENMRSLREGSVVAGWYGGRSTQDELFSLEALSTYLIDKVEANKSEKMNINLNSNLIHVLLKGMRGGILPMLLNSSLTIHESELIDETELSISSLRRILSELRDLEVVEQQQRNVFLDPKIRKQFLRLHVNEAKEHEMNRNLMMKLCRAATDFEILRLLQNRDARWDTYENTLGRCLRILNE
jgi:predicted transcriptional regulator